MEEIIDKWTGKPRPKYLSSSGEVCDDCGAELKNDCAVCGAPVCCPRCCAEFVQATEPPMTTEEPSDD